MPITTTSESYNATYKQWERCRDACSGSDSIKAKGTLYLPALSEQTQQEFDAFKMRGMYYNATGRTHHALIGAVMRKDPVVTVPSVLAALIADATQTRVSFNAFVKMVLAEVLLTGRFGVLIDMPEAPGDRARPYCVGYPAESIINWQTEMIDGIPTLMMVVFCEHVSEEDPDDPYVLTSIEQYRELYLDDGTYHQQLWRKQRHFAPWDRRVGAVPPMLDLIDVNLSHYRSSADLEHERHYCGLPTPVVSGVSDQAVTLKIGSSIAWRLPDPQAKAYMLEFTGQGLCELRMALEAKEKLMAVLGARLLEEQKRSVESAETLAMRNSGEQSVLRSVAGSVSTGLSKCLEWASLWLGVKPASAAKATCKLNTDFLDAQMSFAELTELTKAWQAGAISYGTMYSLMERDEITRPGITAEKEQAEIEIEKPAVIPQNVNPLTGLPDPELNA